MPRPNFSAVSLSRRFRVSLARIALCAAATGAALILWHAARDKPPVMNASAAAPRVYPTRAISPPSPPALPAAGDKVAQLHQPAQDSGAIHADAPHKDARALGLQQTSAASTINVVVGRKDTLGSIFKRMALDPADLAAIRQLPGIRQSLDYLKPGDAIQVTQSEGSIRELTRKVSETRTLHVVREEAGFAAKVIENPVQTHIRTASATIDSSLFQAAESARISDLVALKLANIFAWDIDFVLDIREGDRFTAVYEQIYQDGKYLRDGDVLAAEFVNGGKVYRAVRFVDETGAIAYYSPEGKPMRKAFLRAPVEFTRVSSVFNPHRLHPILNLIRGHMGTDYAAPIGTPVHAAGDGRVAFEGQRGGYGNAILLSHSNEIQTLYGHMSRFARDIHLGQHVQQGEVIGYVGMTGLATGPHLHYEYLMNGVHKDPQTVKLPGADPLRAVAMDRFHAQTAPWLDALAAPQMSVRHAGLASPAPTASVPFFATDEAQFPGERRVSVN